MTFFVPMLMLRNTSIQKAMTLVTGIIFLNMSFFLAEVSALKLDKNQKMIENIAKLIGGAASEEEKDIFGAPSEEDSLTTSELDLFLDGSYSAEFLLLPSQIGFGSTYSEKPISQFVEIAYPPPKV